MRLKKTSYNINIGNSAPGGGRLAGKRLAVLADLHDSDPEPVLDIVRNDRPDAIMIPGDFVLGYFPEGDGYVMDRCRNAMSLLEGCCGIAPTYVSLGNHECMLCDGDYDRLRATGAVLLDNEWTEPAEGILIGGFTSAYAISFKRFRDDYNRQKGAGEYVRYPYRRRPKDISKHPTDSTWLDEFEQADGYKILLCHHPEYWSLREPMLKDRRIDLVLSGHAHGGQWRFMGRGVFAPGQGLLPKYTGGIHQGQYGRLLVSRGLSNPYRIASRLGNPCEAIYLQFV